jgi:hypothetical protein
MVMRRRANTTFDEVEGDDEIDEVVIRDDVPEETQKLYLTQMEIKTENQTEEIATPDTSRDDKSQTNAVNQDEDQVQEARAALSMSTNIKPRLGVSNIEGGPMRFGSKSRGKDLERISRTMPARRYRAPRPSNVQALFDRELPQFSKTPPVEEQTPEEEEPSTSSRSFSSPGDLRGAIISAKAGDIPDNNGIVLGHDELKKRPVPAHLNKANLEAHLSDEEFAQVLGMSRSDFYNLRTWKQSQVKRKVGLL